MQKARPNAVPSPTPWKRRTGTGRQPRACSASAIARCSTRSRNTDWSRLILIGCTTTTGFAEQSSPCEAIAHDPKYEVHSYPADHGTSGAGFRWVVGTVRQWIGAIGAGNERG